MSHKFSLVLVGSLFVVFSFTGASSARADWLIDRTGSLVEIDDVAMVYGSPATVAEVGDYVQPLTVEGVDGNTPQTREIPDSGAKRKQVSLEQRAKLQERFEAQVKVREQRLEAVKQKIQSRVQVENGDLVVIQEVKNEKGESVKTTKTPLAKEEKLHIEKENGDILELKANKDNSIELKDGGVVTRTRTNFPVGISEDGNLTITHKDGTSKDVTVLPEAALKNLEAKGFVPTAPVELAVDEDEPVYVGEATKVKHFLGIGIPALEVRLDKILRVSAEDGAVTEDSSRLSAWQRFLDRFSF